MTHGKRALSLIASLGACLFHPVLGFAQAPPPKVEIKSDLTVGSQADQERLAPGSYIEGAGAANQAFQDTVKAAQGGQPGQPAEPQAETFVTAKKGWQKKGASRIYDAVDGRMIVNDVTVQPNKLTRKEAVREYDNGRHGDEVPRDGVPSRIQVNSTDFIGPRTAANYDELKGIMFAVAAHPDGPQRFFDLPVVSLDWDAEDVPWKPETRTGPGVYRLSSLEKRMYAFVMRDSLDIIRAYQNAEGKDLTPFNDRVDPPTGLESNSQQSRRESQGVDTWNLALSTGKKVKVEKEMLAALAGTEIADASWFPGGYSAVQLSEYRSGTAGALSTLGLRAGINLGLGGYGAQGGFGGYGGGYGGYGGYGGGYGGYGGGGYGGGIRPGAGLIPGGVPPVPSGYNVGVPSPITPAGGALGFAF
ncbi:MAG: hypothetical protein GHCLOJNM_00660 [bacterium]|nr:hypothetical protein [bacterium]